MLCSSCNRPVEVVRTTKTARQNIRQVACTPCNEIWETVEVETKGTRRGWKTATGSSRVALQPHLAGIPVAEKPLENAQKTAVSSDSYAQKGKGGGGVGDSPVSGPDSEKGERKRSSKNSVPPPGFMRFWDLQIRKVSRSNAERVWRRFNCEAITDLVIAGWQRQLPEMRKRDTDKVPYPATWLYGKRWEDEVGKAPVAAPAVQAKLPETRQSLHIRLTAIRSKMAQIRKEQGLEDFCRGKSREHDKLEQEQADIIRALQLLGPPEAERC